MKTVYFEYCNIIQNCPSPRSKYHLIQFAKVIVSMSANKTCQEHLSVNCEMIFFHWVMHLIVSMGLCVSLRNSSLFRSTELVG